MEKHRKWKMELTCDPGFRNQPSCCLFWTIASARRPINWRETTRSLSLEIGVSTGLRFPGQPSPRMHGITIPALLWVTLWTNVVIKWRNKVFLDFKTTMMLWEEFLLNHEKVDFKLIMKQYWLLLRMMKLQREMTVRMRTWKFERSKSSFHDSVYFFFFFFLISSWWIRPFYL